MKIACQTIVFGNPVIKDSMDSILRTVSSIGYDGVEVGARHFYMDRPSYYIELLKKSRLNLLAVHVGGDFLDPDSISTQLAGFNDTVEFARKLGCRYIFVSGTYKQRKTVDDYKRESGAYNEMGRRCQDAGLKLCYHNHDWEMLNQMAGMTILLGETSPELLWLVPDVGWITVSNIDPVRFIADNIDRVEALHFKEFRPIREFAELGTGMVDFESVYRLFAAHRKDFWITAEQDETVLNPAESARINYSYIRKISEQNEAGEV